MIDQPQKPKISYSDADLQKGSPSQISCAYSAISVKSSELNGSSDEKGLVTPQTLPKKVNFIQKDGMGEYRFVKVRNIYLRWGCD